MKNGHVGNGDVGNGHVGNGHVGNGDVGNGQVGNGHVGNGDVGGHHKTVTMDFCRSGILPLLKRVTFCKVYIYEWRA